MQGKRGIRDGVGYTHGAARSVTGATGWVTGDTGSGTGATGCLTGDTGSGTGDTVCLTGDTGCLTGATDESYSDVAARKSGEIVTDLKRPRARFDIEWVVKPSHAGRGP